MTNYVTKNVTETVKFIKIISDAWFAQDDISVDNWTWSSSSVAASRGKRKDGKLLLIQFKTV